MAKRVMRSKLGWVVLGGACIAASCGETRYLGEGENGARAGMGTLPGGTHGDAGSGGSAGTEPIGGHPEGGKSGGTGGDAGGGGEGGMCESVEPIRIACPREEDGWDGFDSECSLEETRAELRCGSPGTNLDASCCPRQSCRNDADCGEDALCIPRLTNGPDAEGGSHPDSCSQEGMEPLDRSRCSPCSCAVTADYDTRAYCISKDEDLAAFDCKTEGLSCDKLAQFYDVVMTGTFLGTDELQGDQREERSLACLLKLESAILERCQEETCRCTEENCTTSVVTFCPSVFGVGCPSALDAFVQGDPSCAWASEGVYTECDGTLRFSWTEGGENTYDLEFDKITRTLGYGYATGGVFDVCPTANPDLELKVRAGLESPTDQFSRCRNCHFCWGVDGTAEPPAGLPECTYDADGHIQVPEVD